ncbi:unnamed protein product [Ectocarpus sp. CCAP 1310/34]|nr:unnamed protein product [Ectocarpus sp. CCAP 1310/34]
MARLLPPPAIISQRRVVVTGLGAVTPLANGMQASWERLLEGKCGIRRLKPSSLGSDGHSSRKLSDRMTTFPTSLAGEVDRGFERAGQFPGPDSTAAATSLRGTPEFIQFAMHAAKEALDMSGWRAETERERDRAGVAIGSGIGSLEDVADCYRTLEGRGYRRLTPHFIPRILINLAAGHVAIEHGLKGPNHAVATACATGAHAIGDAFRFVKHGDADVMVCGGSEGSVHEPALAGFARMNALSTRFNEDPERASRPFDKDRDGFVLAGKGAAVLVLEEMEHARDRGANIIAEVRGYGLAGDAHHIAAPTEDGDGPRRAMLSAVEESGLSPESVGYVNAHATSTPLGDAAEGRAIERVFGKRQSLLVSSTKGATGHLLGAAGSLEAAFSILALRDGVVPHTLNLATPDPTFGFTMVKGAPAKMDDLDAVMSNSFGFGGTNVSLLFSRV